MNRQGFTLIEMIVVLMIIMLLLTLCVPFMQRITDGEGLLQAQSILVGDLRFLQNSVRSQGEKGFWYPQGDGYILELIDHNQQRKTLLKRQLPKGVKVSTESTSVQRVVFRADGSAESFVTISLTRNHCRKHQAVVYKTGRIREAMA